MWTYSELCASAEYDERRRLITRMATAPEIPSRPARARGRGLGTRTLARGLRSLWATPSRLDATAIDGRGRA